MVDFRIEIGGNTRKKKKKCSLRIGFEYTFIIVHYKISILHLYLYGKK